MPINDPAALQPLMCQAVTAWLAAGQGRFWITSGLRTRQEQIDLRVSNGCPDIWTSPASSCRVPTAIPGTSKHERGEAVDIGGDKSYARYLAPKYGLGLTVPGEDWHFEVTDPAVAARVPTEEFTMADIDRLIAKLDETIKVIQNQGEAGRKSTRRQALLTRVQIAKQGKADQKDLDAILKELVELGPEEAEG